MLDLYMSLLNYNLLFIIIKITIIFINLIIFVHHHDDYFPTGSWDFYYEDKSNKWLTSYDSGERFKPQQRPVFYDGKN